MLDTDLCRALPNNLGTVLSIIQSFLGTRCRELRMINLSKDFNVYQSTFNYFRFHPKRSLRISEDFNLYTSIDFQLFSLFLKEVEI
jgi:hypothetical protein